MTELERKMTNGYGVAALEAAFDAVKDPQDWKAPIAVWVLGESVNVVVEAIKFYTATVPTVELNLDRMQYYVASVGYRAGPAGDD